MPTLPRLDRSRARAIYLGAAVLLGVVMAVDVLPSVAVYGLIAVYSIGSIVFRQRVLHEGPWSRADLASAVAFVIAFIPVAFVLHRWPFR